MINIECKKNCCGCSACMNKCPKKAITMKADDEGFLYPCIDKSKCINCNLCEKVCPIINNGKFKVEKNKFSIKSYAIRCNNKETLKKSTSGGFFTPISNYVLDNGGYIVGVTYDEKLNIFHKIIDNNSKDELKKMVGSKYVQSDMGTTFSKVKELLEKGKMVLFSGTPCQVEGLLLYLGKEYDNLITVDVICHGVPSQKLWKIYANLKEKKYNSKIKSFNFRNKTYGYHSGSMKLVFANGREYYGSARTDEMLKSFFTEISSRPSCYECKFKKMHHKSDFTIFDCWSASKLNKNIKDDDKGYTNLFINTRKGNEFFNNNLKDEYVMYETDYNKALEMDGIMILNSAIPHKNRDCFYIDLNEETFDSRIRELIPISKKDRILEASKKYLYKMHILQFMKKIRGGK